MARGWVGCVAASCVLVAPAAAWADEEIRAAPPNRYTTPQVTIDQGERLTFANTDIASHDVTHRADQPQFRSDIVGQGETSFVEGSQYLTSGTYDFFCSIHPEMTGTLTVTDQGTPEPRPGTGTPTPPDTQEPAVALELGRHTARRVRRTGRVRMLVGADEASNLSVRVSLGMRRAGRLRIQLGSAGTRRVEVRLSRAARERVRRGRRLVVLVRAEDAAGNTGTDERSTRLR